MLDLAKIKSPKAEGSEAGEEGGVAGTGERYLYCTFYSPAPRYLYKVHESHQYISVLQRAGSGSTSDGATWESKRNGDVHEIIAARFEQAQEILMSTHLYLQLAIALDIRV